MSVNYSIYHPVPALIQPQSWSCWYTSLQMVVGYQRSRGLGAGLVDPSENDWTQSLYDANHGVGATPDEREQVARALGFQVLFACLNSDGIADILTNAPIIYAGQWPGRTSGHWVVMVGISENLLAINNPASGMETYDYDYFVGQYLQQTEDRPVMFP